MSKNTNTHTRNRVRGFGIAAFVIANIGVGAAVAQEQPLEEITVTGIRASLADALALKRGSDEIVDAVSSEDIGKLPDENVAESMQRLVGVQIQRRNGEGAGFSVRGLAQNRLEIDGVTLVNPTGRNSAPSEGTFNVLQFVPSELLSGIKVAKSASADQIEGSLGGTVTLSLLNPLEVGNRVAVSVQGSYDDRTEDIDPRGSITWSTKSADEKLGLLLSLSTSERSVGEELFFSRTGWSEGTLGAAPGDIRLQTLEEDRERLGFAGILQWRPNDTSEYYLKTFLASFDLDRDRSWFSSGGSGGTDAAGYLDTPTVSPSGTILTGQFLSQIQGNGESLTNESETYNIVVGGKWDRGPWNISARLSHGEATQEDRQDFARVRQNDVTFFRDFTGTIPRLDVVDGFDTLNPASYDSGSGLIGFSNIINHESDETAFQLDFDQELNDGGFFTSIEYGLRWADQTSLRNQLRAGNATGGGVWVVDTTGGLAGNVDGLYETVSLSDLFGGSASNQAAYIAADPDGLGGTSQLLAAAGAQFFPQLDADFGTDETLASLYVMGSFESEWGPVPVSGNIGARWIQTDQDTVGFEFSPTVGGLAPASLSRDYDDILPSLNVRFDLREDVTLRFAASRVLSRPPTGALRFGLSLDEAAGTASAASPTLDPFEADAFDVSLEWYVSEDAALFGTLFYKDVAAFFETTTSLEVIPGAVNSSAGANPGDPFLVTRTANGSNGDITGFELGYQGVFGSGFGVQLNYTFLDASTPTGLPLEGLSENSYNAIGYYENDQLSARVSYNFRDDYLAVTSFNGVALFEEGRGQVDFSVSYNFTDSFAAFVEGINLNDERVDQFATLEERPFRIGQTGRRFFFGVRTQF